IASLQVVDRGAPRPPQGLRLPREDLHRLHVRDEEGEVVLDEGPELRLGPLRPGEALPEAAEHGLEALPLDPEEEVLLPARVVVEAREADPRLARDVPHRGAVEPLPAEDAAGGAEDPVAPFLEPTRAARPAPLRGHAGAFYTGGSPSLNARGGGPARRASRGL